MIRLILIAVFLHSNTWASAQSVPSPSAFLGFEVGADRKLADYRQIASYFRALDTASPRVETVSLGKTTRGEDMLMAIISSEQNLRNQRRIREISKKLADPRGLSEAETDSLVRDGKVVLLITCNIHSTEIGASQMAMEWAHALATATDSETRRRLENVVILLVPSLNPDGQTMETEWYRKNLGTKYEGGRMPWLYHDYTGHDNNRDWYMLTQKETQAMNRAVYREWFPQVWLDEHQMGGTGPRIFVPPYAEPVDPDIHPLIWREVNLMGAHMALRLEQAGKSGIVYGYAFDAYWPGGTKNTAWWKNITGILTEVASPRIATPIHLEPGELTGGRKGLLEYAPQTNFPNPWPGGWWRLRDVMDYERICSDSILETCANHRQDLLRNMLRRSRASIAAAKPGEAFRIPRKQRDWPTALKLAKLMVEHGVDVRSSSTDIWIPLEQPYGPFVREMFEPQRYPEVKLVTGSEIVRPYDVSAWTLPLMMGVTVEKAVMPNPLPATFTGDLIVSQHADPGYVAIPPGSPQAAKVVNAAMRKGSPVYAVRFQSPDPRHPIPGSFVVQTSALNGDTSGIRFLPAEKPAVGAPAFKTPRVGLYKPWTASMDEGWTRWVLEQYGFDPKPLDNKAIQAGNLRERFDAIVLPDVSKETLTTGRPSMPEGSGRLFPELPPEYMGGLGKDGAQGLKDFVEGGGTLIAFASACEYVLEEFPLPVRNALAGSGPDTFSCPGSLLRVKVNQDHPVTYGLPAETAVFVDSAIAFQTSLPTPDVQRWVLASYPEDSRDILLSGWIRGEERLERRAAAVAVTHGKGKIILLGFRPQHRAQTHATFPILFNAIYWSVLDSQ